MKSWAGKNDAVRGICSMIGTLYKGERPRCFAREYDAVERPHLTKHLPQLDPLSMRVMLLPFFPHASGGTVFVTRRLGGRTNFYTNSLEAGAKQT